MKSQLKYSTLTCCKKNHEKSHLPVWFSVGIEQNMLRHIHFQGYINIVNPEGIDNFFSSLTNLLVHELNLCFFFSEKGFMLYLIS